MAYRYGQHHQQMLFPQSIDEYVPEDATVRAYDAIIEAMELAAMGFELDPHKAGCPQYDPWAMLKLLVYGYSYGIRSSRKLERECYYNLSFIWLMGDLKPDHKTIAEFRRRNKRALKQVIRQCARLCIKLGLIEGNTLFVDSTRMRAHAAIQHSLTPEKARQVLAEIDQRIEKVLTECEAVDQDEQDHTSLVHLQAELKDQHVLKNKVKTLLQQLQTQEKASINTTDPDCVRIHGRQGAHAGYTGQIVVDDQHGLIVHSQVVSANQDQGYFSEPIAQANETLDEPCEVACGDAGFADTEDLAKVDAQNIHVIVPSQKQAEKQKPGPFDKSHFRYDSQRDVYICPMGHCLYYRSSEKNRPRRRYYPGGVVCRECPNFGACTTDRLNGRKITRAENEALREKLAAQYASPEGQAIFSHRKEKVEHPFGHIKRNQHADHFLLRGLSGVRAEMSLLSSCFNIARLISILGVAGILARFSG